jgi:hypothetical protein
LNLQAVTGVRVYKELARIAGVDCDSMTAFGRRIAISDSLYSVALGTLELSLLEQAHLFNMLYNNDLIERPAAHPSLFVDSIALNGTEIPVAALDTVRHFHPFADINNLRPTLLGMHKRLIGNAADGLAAYDAATADTLATDSAAGFNPDLFMIDEPLANYAKSGTTDDVMRPFNVDAASPRRTNYGLWNAVIRIDLGRLANSADPDIHDVTVACVAECNSHYTGVADGKTLHKFLTRDLLRMAGVPVQNGFFAHYEKYIKSVTPDTVFARCCGEVVEQERHGGLLQGIRAFFDRRKNDTTAAPVEEIQNAIEGGDIE